VEPGSLTPAKLVALLLLAALAGCSSSSGGSAAPTPAEVSGPSPWDLPSPTHEPPLPSLQDPADPIVIAYCSVQDRVITLEGRLLTDPPPLDSALSDMRRAQRAAGLSVEVFRNAGKPELARLAQRWTDSFDAVQAHLRRGERPIDALEPAIRTLGALERRFSCELDG
jgi:hypothetical protein